MALCCIGGVCIPYSALIPLAVYALKWLLQMLVQFGILPKSFHEHITSFLHPKAQKLPHPQERSISSLGSSSSGDVVRKIASVEEWVTITEQPRVIVKFTAAWCAPCKTIQPAFVDLASEHPGTVFGVADADDLDEIAAQHAIAMLPTFLILEKGEVKGRYSGSNEVKLREFVEKYLLN